MNHNMSPAPPGPYAMHPHHSRREAYPGSHMQQQYAYPYGHPMPYHQHPQPYPPQWVPPYPYYPAVTGAYPRQFQPQSPLVVSSYPNSQPVLPSPRHATQAANQVRTPSLDPTTPSVISQPIVSTSTTPSSGHLTNTTPDATSSSQTLPSPPAPMERMPFYPSLPWYSVDASLFPARIHRQRRRRRVAQAETALELPARDSVVAKAQDSSASKGEVEPVNHERSGVSPPSISTGDEETPQTSLAPSEEASTHPTTPASPAAPTMSSSDLLKKVAARPVVPIVPITPRNPKNQTSESPARGPEQSAEGGEKTPVAATAETSPTIVDDEASKAVAAPPKAPPKSWAELLRSKSGTASGAHDNVSMQNGIHTNESLSQKAHSLAEAIDRFSISEEARVAFLEPRGLVNTGNMCYMNSILQVLVFCVPFYNFLDQVGKRAIHSFKSNTPLIEAMILFMREYLVIDSAVSVDQLRLRLKSSEFEQYGEPLIPEYVYEVIRKLPKFSAMRRGHQQDAEEFLGFLLQGLHDECVTLTKIGEGVDVSSLNEPSPFPNNEPTAEQGHGSGGWLEVGPKQKSAVTRSSGDVSTESPITKIFGGKLRSEFRVPGLKNSVTYEPYQPLQLDIGDPQVSNITEALKGLTRSETIHGDFKSPRGPGVSAAKQVFIETLPPVLILHLKRFQYDNTGGTQKIWKKVGYPLELEIPKEVFAPSKRGQYMIRPGGLPKYRLISVVYHHGKNASGGHYTVDVRRQEGREWIRLDDTFIQRIRSEDVAKEGGEEDPKVIAAAIEEHRRNQSTSSNLYSQAGFDDLNSVDEDDEGEWSQVHATATSPKSSQTTNWSGIVNGTASSAQDSNDSRKSREAKASTKDNKVAYILIYQQFR